MIEKGNYKIDVSNLTTAERTRLQEELFKQGYRWICGAGQVITKLNSDFMFLSDEMNIECCTTRDFFESGTETLITVADILSSPQPITEPTISLRDYFAGQALFGLMAMHPLSDRQVAKRAFEYADAMLKERSK